MVVPAWFSVPLSIPILFNMGRLEERSSKYFKKQQEKLAPVKKCIYNDIQNSVVHML